MNQPRGALRATLAALLAACAAQSQAVTTFDTLGGELEMNGFVQSTVRSRVAGGDGAYIGQWIQRLQIELGLNYDNVGPFDKLSYVTVLRPEYDIAHDLGDFGSNKLGSGATDPSNAQRAPFNANTDKLGFSGFDFILGTGATSTGGIGKIVSMGYENQAWLAKNFEVDFRRNAQGTVVTNNDLKGGFSAGNVSAFPLVVQKGSSVDTSGFPGLSALNGHLNCRRCTDMNLSDLDVATGMTDSNGRIYPFRELYADAVAGDFWFRLGKQQIVWGKTDFFRLQDVINPIDFGQHFFFDSFEDIRIPQWMLSMQWKAGSWGPLTDNAVQVVWNFDRFQPVGLGNPAQMWAHPFAKDISTFGIFNTFFSPEPCVNLAIQQQNVATMGLNDVCGMGANGQPNQNDRRLPSGFGQPVGLSANRLPGYSLNDTQAGWRWEFRVSDFRVAVSHWYGFNQVPVFQFHSVSLPTRYFAAGTVLPNDVLIGDLVGLRKEMAALGALPTANPTDVARAAIKGGNKLPFAGSLAGVNDPILVTTPMKAAKLLRNASDPALAKAAQNAIATGNFAKLWDGSDPALRKAGIGAAGGFYAPFANCGSSPFGPEPGTYNYAGGTFCSPLAGGQTSEIYRQSHTLGLSLDYFEQYTGTVWRVESSWTLDELVENTQSVDFVGKTDVMRWSIGIDRPTFLKWLNKDRTFFLSWQLFDTWYMDHQGDKHTGMLNDTHNFITTFFFIGNYMRDRLKPVGFYVWEEASNSHVAGLNLEWLMDNHWSVKGGFHTIWGGTGNSTHDTGPFTNFITSNNSFQQTPFVNGAFGLAHEGIGALRNYDEIFFELKYQF